MPSKKRDLPSPKAILQNPALFGARSGLITNSANDRAAGDADADDCGVDQ